MSFFLRQELKTRVLKIVQTMPSAYIVVRVESQKLFCINDGSVAKEYTISTSQYGTGNIENSNRTPLGIHRIIEKIGAGMPAGTVFRDRIDTGERWLPGQPGENMILTRILRLEGLEQGINRGPGIDSYERYIYIHGTNKEDRIGTPLSNGCVVMRNSDIVGLFDLVEEGTFVIID
jgi:UDP-N-acetylmuramate--alanine ligase